MKTQTEMVLHLHDQGKDTTEAARLARLPWMITKDILLKNGRTIRTQGEGDKNNDSTCVTEESNEPAAK